jgi:hypothetical protein
MGAFTVLPASAEPAAPEGGQISQIDVKNPVGMTLKGTKIVDPKAGTAEHTLLAALSSQAKNGTFKAFLGFMHPKTKAESVQVESLEAYQYKSSLGAKAQQCVHDDGKALVTVSKKDVDVAVEGGGNVGVKVMVWCGEGRMPVPFTLYPDGDVFRVTVWGLN